MYTQLYASTVCGQYFHLLLRVHSICKSVKVVYSEVSGAGPVKGELENLIICVSPKTFWKNGRCCLTDRSQNFPCCNFKKIIWTAWIRIIRLGCSAPPPPNTHTHNKMYTYVCVCARLTYLKNEDLTLELILPIIKHTSPTHIKVHPCTIQQG